MANQKELVWSTKTIGRNPGRNIKEELFIVIKIVHFKEKNLREKSKIKANPWNN